MGSLPLQAIVNMWQHFIFLKPILKLCSQLMSGSSLEPWNKAVSHSAILDNLWPKLLPWLCLVCRHCAHWRCQLHAHISNHLDFLTLMLRVVYCHHLHTQSERFCRLLSVMHVTFDSVTYSCMYSCMVSHDRSLVYRIFRVKKEWKKPLADILKIAQMLIWCEECLFCV